MTDPADPYAVTTAEQLAELFGDVSEAAIRKEISFIHPHYRALIEASPFAVLATCGSGGMDASPRGDPPGFVAVEDEKTLLIPERRGNNRVDSLRNIVADPRVALLFLIPGVGEMLRVQGRARITTEPALLARFALDGKPPRCVVVVQVESVFFQCARALLRSRLWEPASWPAERTVPSPGTMLAALGESRFDGETYDRELSERQSSTLY
jgi:PPOX class probable FMN-dependent enzyme